MAADAVLEILKGIQSQLGDIKGELHAMRSEIDGGFHMMAGTDGRVEGLRRIIDGHGQRLTALERKGKP